MSATLASLRGVIGATGRMGQALVRVATERPAAAHHRRGGHRGQRAPRARRGRAGRRGLAWIVTVTDDLAAALGRVRLRHRLLQSPAHRGEPQPPAAPPASRCWSARPAIAAALETAIARAARDIALLIAANTSLGVTLLLELVRRAAAALPLNFDVEIIEAAPPHEEGCALGHRAGARGRPWPGRAVSVTAAVSVPRGGAAPRGRDRLCRWCAPGISSVSTPCSLPGQASRWCCRTARADRAIFARGALAAAALAGVAAAGALCHEGYSCGLKTGS